MAIMDPRIGRLSGSFSIICACGYNVSWPADLAIRRLGPYTRPAHIRLKCSACGARSQDGKVRWSGDMR